MPGCREIVKNGENGLLVPAQNIPELAKALAQLLQNPELRKRMGIAGRAMVEQDYSERYVIAQTLALYEGLLA